MKKIIKKKEIETSSELVQEHTKQVEAKKNVTKPSKRKEAKNIQKIFLEQDDFTLENEGKHFVTKKAKKFKVTFASDLSEKKVFTIQKDGHPLSMAFQGRNANMHQARKAKGKIKKNQVQYLDVEDGVDLIYQCRANGIKESVVIHQKQENYDFNFTLQIGDLTPIFNEKENTLELQKEGKSIYRIASPFMTDRNGKRSDDCSYEIEQNENELKLVLHCDAAWIESLERAFPILVDPTIEVVSSSLFQIETLVNGEKDETVESLTIGKVQYYPNWFYYGLRVLINAPLIQQEYRGITQIQMRFKTKELGSQDNLDSDLYVARCGEQELALVTKREMENEWIFDITPYVQQATSTVELILYHIDDGNLEISETRTVIKPPVGAVLYDSRVYFYGLEEEEGPCLLLEKEENGKVETKENQYAIGRAGTTYIQVNTGHMRHEHPDQISIQQGKNMLSLSHHYDDQSRNKNEVGLGKGWTSNFHQYIKKSQTYHEALGYREITYIDGEGKPHDFKEYWYYLDENEKRIFVDRDKIYQDVDQKWKYESDDGHIYEVQYEIKNDENLTYISGKNLTAFPEKPTKQKKYFVSYGYGKKEIDIHQEKQHLQFYYYSPKTKQKIYLQPASVYKSEEGYFCNANGVVACIDEKYESVITKQNDGSYCFSYQETEFEGEPDVSNYHMLNKIDGIILVEETLSGSLPLEDVYQNEDIINLDNQIKSVKNYIEELTLSKASTFMTYERLIKQFADQMTYYQKQDQMMQHEETMQNVQDSLQNMQKQFHTDIGNDCLKVAADTNDINDETLVYTGKTNITDDADATKILNAFNHLYQRKSNREIEGGTYEQSQSEYRRLGKEIQGNQKISSFENIADQLTMYDQEVGKISRQLEEYEQQLASLMITRNHLIEEQKKQVNDFIIDQEGDTLGFDGYGRLILIQDKYENKMEIEYGYEKENEGKMLSIFSDTQTIRMHYDKATGLLSSIVDPQGKKTKYDYHSDQQLISITYSDGQKTTFDYTNGFQATSPLLERIEVVRHQQTMRVSTYHLKSEKDEQGVYRNIIDEITKLTGNEPVEKEIEELYLFDETDHQTIIRNQMRYPSDALEAQEEDLVYLFDTKGNVIKIKDGKNTSVFHYQEKKCVYEATYKNHASIFGSFTPNASSSSHHFDVSRNSLPISNLLGIKIDGEGMEDQTYRVSVSISHIEGEESITETQEYGVFSSSCVLPIPIDHRYPLSLDIEILSDANDFVMENVGEMVLIPLENGTIYTYDENHNLIKEKDGYSTKKYLDYDADQLCHQTIESNIYGEEITTKYGYNDFKQLTYSEDSKGNVEEYYYDEKGNCIEKRVYNKKDASLMKVEKVSYDEQGRPTSTIGAIKKPDGSDAKEEISYLPGTNIESKIKGVNGESVCYQYDYHTGDLLSISSSSMGINNSTTFTYHYGLLTSMSHHGMKVEYAYDGKGRKVKTKLNGKEVLWNTYTDHFDGNYTDPFNEDMEVSFQGSYTNSTTLDGLFTESFVDEDGKQVLTKYSGDDSFGAAQTLYDEKERVSVVCSQMTDRDTNQTYQEKIVNTYDDFDEIVKQEKKINGVSEVILETHYDENHRWIVSSDVILSQEDYRLNTMNTYNDDHQVTEIQIREGIIGEEAEDSFVPVSETTLSYDVLGRVIHQNLHANKIDICHEYSYLQQDENSLDLIAEDITKIKIQNGNQTTYLTETMRYEYDVNGNIVTMESDENKTRYAYDALNRLIREDNPLLNQSIVYKYDQAGNLLLKKTYAYTLEEKLYAPEVKEYIYDCDHRDQLIFFDGKSIAYDSMGRPTTYKDDEFEWNNQGQLTYIVKENGDAIEYLYDTNGIRRKKIINGNETSYLSHGSQILSMKHGVATFVFRYVLNKLVGFHYNNGSQCKEYLYQRNIQGDIIGIFDDDGNQVGGYAYDAYGNHVITIDEGGIATLNPFRYRGYYWDEESHLYYLNSRYYDPETGRFISPDDISYLDPETICGLNLYAYCSNNPVNYYDPDGHWAMPNWLKWVIGGVVIIGLGIATLATGGAAAGVAGFIVAGAFKGAVIGAISGALVSGTIGGISSVISGNDFWSGFLDGAADGFMSGAIIGGITGAISSGVQVANAAKMWQAGTSARTSTPFKTMQHHYQTHVINEGFAKGNNIVKYTKDAINFANRNASVLKFQVSYNSGLQPFWTWIGKIGMNGQFTSAGKILTFWYVAL